jgi:hypothetical protein
METDKYTGHGKPGRARTGTVLKARATACPTRYAGPAPHIEPACCGDVGGKCNLNRSLPQFHANACATEACR